MEEDCVQHPRDQPPPSHLACSQRRSRHPGKWLSTPAHPQHCTWQTCRQCGTTHIHRPGVALMLWNHPAVHCAHWCTCDSCADTVVLATTVICMPNCTPLTADGHSCKHLTADGHSCKHLTVGKHLTCFLFPAADAATTHSTYLLYDMLPMPATKGAKVRTMGTKRASTTVLPPYLA